MPNILVKVPKGLFAGEGKNRLVTELNSAAAAAEQIPDNPRNRALCWVVIEEVDPGNWTCGGADVSGQIITLIAMVYVPQGVLDEASRALYVKLVDRAFKNALPSGETRKVATSIMLHDVADGTWGPGGDIWHLPTFTARAGFVHLQHLVQTA